jgi:PAS domain S-box-containing protein
VWHRAERERVQGFWPFVLVALLGQLSLYEPWSRPDHPGWALVATVAFAVTFVAALVGMFRGAAREVTLLAPYLALFVVALWRQADGGASSGYTALFAVPVLWFALHESIRQVWIAVAGVAVLLSGPILLVGAPDYPASDWRWAALWVAIAALIGPLTHRVVEQREAASRRAEALEPARSHLEGILQGAVGHSIIATDLEGVITVFNAGAQHMLGWSEEEALGCSLTDLVHDREELVLRAHQLGVDPGIDVLVGTARLGGSEAGQWTYLSRTGGRIPVSLTMSSVRGPEEDLVGFIAVASDITVMSDALASLAAEREVYRLLVEHLPSTVVGLLDEELRWEAVGGEYRGQKDYEGRRGMAVGVTLEPEVAQRLQAFFRQGFEQHVSTEFETRRGEWFDIDALPVTNAAGEARILSVSRDVTDRHLAEQERQHLLDVAVEGEERFRRIFENAPIGVALVTAVDDPRTRLEAGRLVRVNAAFAELLGRDPDSMVGVAVNDFTHPDDRLAEGDLGAVGEQGVLQKRYLHSSGRAIWCEIAYARVTPSEPAGAYFITHIQDITSRRASERSLLDTLERQRAAVEALRAAEVVRTEVMSTISHELRTPLTSIAGYIEVLADGHGGDLTDQQREMLQTVERNATRLMTLVDDLLVLAGLDESPGGRDDSWDSISVQDLVRECVETVRPITDRRAQDLHLVGPPARAQVHGDRDLLDRALINLLGNASKYTHPGGRIELRVDERVGGVDISVTDDGVGIPSQEINRLFTRFFRASTAAHTGESGTGLGLAIVKSAIELHGGLVRVSSALGVGSTFTVHLPTHQDVVLKEVGDRHAPTA